MGIQLCAVLDYLHSQQPALTFRDIKPENVMLSADGRLVLIDFDIACAQVAMWDSDFPVAGAPGPIDPRLAGGGPPVPPPPPVYRGGAALSPLPCGPRPPPDIKERDQRPAYSHPPPCLRS